MKTERRLVSGIALFAAGAAAAIAASNIKVTFNPQASAQPPVIAETKAALATLAAAQPGERRTFAQVASQLSPSVVRISITKTEKMTRGRSPFGPGGGNPFRGTPWERFFGDNGDNDEGAPQEGPKQHGMGSGVVIDQKGFILTNNHVVDGADKVEVTFDNGKTVPGKVVGTDPKTDLAVVKVDGVEVKPAKLGDSDRMQVGDWVMAIGNPFGLDHTVTVGVLSAKGRSGLHGGPNYEDFLQTDASINPGNSGGPLVNLDGEIVGINTMIAGIGTGIGFAVPSSMATPVVEQLIQSGKVRRAFLGIHMQDVTPDLQKTLGSNVPEKGALVAQVQAGSPADKAGVKHDDVIIDVDGLAVDGSRAVQRTVLTKKIGQKIDLGIWRDGKTVHVSTTTGELPDGEQAQVSGGGTASPKAKLGLGLQSLTPQLAERLGLDAKARGVVVSSVREGSPSDEVGLKEGDVILEVDRHSVASAEDAVRILSSAHEGGHLLRIRRGDAALFVVLPTS